MRAGGQVAGVWPGLLPSCGDACREALRVGGVGGSARSRSGAARRLSRPLFRCARVQALPAASLTTGLRLCLPVVCRSGVSP